MKRAPRRKAYALQLGEPRHGLLENYAALRLGRSVKGASTALRLLELSLSASTYKQYGELFGAFAEYCADQNLSPLPADPWTVVAYVGHLAELGTWAADSLQPICSAINRVHRDLGEEPPAVGNHFLSAVRRGLGRAQVALRKRDTRVPLPAYAVHLVITDGEDACELTQLREAAAIALAALFLGRQDSAVHLRTEDIGLEPYHIWLRLTEKGRKHKSWRRIVKLPLDQPPVRGVASVLPRVAALLHRVRDEKGEEQEFFFQLPGEPRPLTRHMEGWVANALARVHVQAPPGFAYLGHSLRSMGASVCVAIDVERIIWCWLGGWVPGSTTPDVHYVDPTVLPTPAGYALYGWMLSRSYSTGEPDESTAPLLADPRADPQVEW